MAANNLKKLLQPILLQRKKTDFEDVLKLPEKLELAVWIPLSSRQRGLYSQYLEGRQLKKVLSQNSYPIEAVNYLKTLCRHPFLTEATIAVKRGQTSGSVDPSSSITDINDLASALGAMGIAGRSTKTKNGFDDSDDPMEEEQFPDGSVFGIVGRNPAIGELMNDSVKLQVFVTLVQQLRRQGHRTLVFSQSKLMLDIIQRVLTDLGISTSRIDGSVCGRERQEIIDDVNDENSRVDVCLLTTKACGFGITLTGADRVIVFDPSWNPAEDRQAVDRAYRIGQKNKVIVYRLIMAGTVEEKMYEKQVFKDGLRVVSERGSSKRYFSDQETKELFVLDSHTECSCMKRLWGYDDSCKIVSCPDMDSTPLQGVMGYSKHDALYLSTLKQKKTHADVKVSEKKSYLNCIEAAPIDLTHNDRDLKAIQEKSVKSHSDLCQQKITSIYKPNQSSEPSTKVSAKPQWPDRKKVARPAWPIRGSSLPSNSMCVDLTDDSPEAVSVNRSSNCDNVTCEDLLKDLEKLVINKSDTSVVDAGTGDNEFDNRATDQDTEAVKEVIGLLDVVNHDSKCDNSCDGDLGGFNLDLTALNNIYEALPEERDNLVFSDGNNLENSDSDDESERQSRVVNSRIRSTKTALKGGGIDVHSCSHDVTVVERINVDDVSGAIVDGQTTTNNLSPRISEKESGFNAFSISDSIYYDSESASENETDINNIAELEDNDTDSEDEKNVASRNINNQIRLAKRVPGALENSEKVSLIATEVVVNESHGESNIVEELCSGISLLNCVAQDDLEDIPINRPGNRSIKSFVVDDNSEDDVSTSKGTLHDKLQKDVLSDSSQSDDDVTNTRRARIRRRGNRSAYRDVAVDHDDDEDVDADDDEGEGEVDEGDDVDMADEEGEDEEEEDDTCGGFIVPDSADEEDLSDSSQSNDRRYRTEVIDLLDSSSEEGEFSPSNKPRRNRRDTLKMIREPAPHAGVSTHIQDLLSFEVVQIPPISVQKSDTEMKKQSPTLQKKVIRSRRCLDMSQIFDYNDLLSSAVRLESCKKWQGCTSLYLKALEICDDDIHLHKKLFILEKMLA